MDITLKNEALTVTINSEGAQLTSILGSDGTEYLWQGDPAYWKKQAPHLFPYVGRLTNGQYTLDGKAYETDTHGFYRWRETECTMHTENEAVFRLASDDETKTQYPFDFATECRYQLLGNVLHIEFAVQNHSAETMYYAYGGHPGFNVPLEADRTFEDYTIQFESGAAPAQINMTKSCFVGEGSTLLHLQQGRKLPLSHEMFDNDAIILQNPGGSATLAAKGGTHSVTVNFAGLPYLGIWHPPGTNAPFVCIEPWTSLPSRQDVVEDIGTKPDMCSLAPGAKNAHYWTIRCE